MKNILWKILLGAGILPLAAPFVMYLYRASIETWAFADWIVLYSYLFWWTYVLGLVLIAVSCVMLLKKRGNQDK